MFDVANNTEFLTAIGINDVSEDVKQRLIAGIEDLAKSRLVTKISSRITDNQAEEFERITDEGQAIKWLKTNISDFPELVKEVFEEIKYEIIEHKLNVGER